MLPLVEVPAIVQHYAPFFASVFSPRAFHQFQRYLSGLIVSENKTVEGINRLFVLDVRNQSSLNRLLTESPFSVAALHQARLALLQSLPGTAMKPKGVLSVDDTLLTHYGKHFDKIAYLYDSTHECYVWAHNLVNLHYSDDLTDYPINCRLWEPAELEAIETGLLAAGIRIRPSKYPLKDSDPKKWRQYLLGVWRRHQHKPAVAKLYQSKLLLAQQLLSEFFTTHPQARLPVTFDNWYTQPADSAAYFICNQLKWQAAGITRIRRHRWPVEVYHEEGKSDGLDQYQVRDFAAISRHIALVAVTYSLLRAAQHDTDLLHKLQRHVQTQLDGSAGSWRRNTQAHALWSLATFIATGLAQGQTLPEVIKPLVAMFAY